MRHIHPAVLLAVLSASISATGCGLISGAIKMGLWIGIILLLIVIGIIGLLLRRTA